MSTSTRATGAVSAGSQAAALRRRVAAALALASSTAARSPGSISASGASWDVMPQIVSAPTDGRTGWGSPTPGGGCVPLEVVDSPLERGLHHEGASPASDAGGSLQLVGAVGVL